MSDSETMGGPTGESPIDETGLDPKDIELVMAQANTGRRKAVEALRASGGDLIGAVMQLEDAS